MTTSQVSMPERNLDTLRAVAVLCVLGDHIGLALEPVGGSRLLLSQIGHAGVLLFFVHTSLVLMASLERGGQAPGWIRTFYIRRAMRIYPLAIATVLLAVAVGIPAGIPHLGVHRVAHNVAPKVVLSNLFLIENLTGARDIIAPYWSLPLEVDMYVLLPFCWLAARRQSRLALAGVFLALVAANFLVSSPLPAVWRLSVFHYGPCFFAGVLAYRILLERRSPVLPSGALFALLAVAIALVPLLGMTMATYARAWIPGLLVGVSLPYIAELAPSALTRGSKVVATYSYGIYLLHVPVLWFAFDVCRSLPTVVQLLIMMVGLVILPWAAFNAIERPCIQGGQALSGRRLTLASTQPAP